MGSYAGFDTLNYPGTMMMDWLYINSNLQWCGYYLAPAPNRPPSGWEGQYQTIKSRWGVAPIYVGQQDPRTATHSYTPSSILTSDQGAIDGAEAIGLMISDQFPDKSFVYLDWEYGGLDADGSAYVSAWLQTVADDGRVRPGIYCSHVIAPQIARLIDNLNPTPIVRFWCWKVPTVDPHPYEGDIQHVPAPNPSGCGFAGADSWQREQNAVVDFPKSAPLDSLQVDFSTSAFADPGGPVSAATHTFELKVLKLLAGSAGKRGAKRIKSTASKATPKKHSKTIGSNKESRPKQKTKPRARTTPETSDKKPRR